jgi:hypothetical protein
MNSIISIDDDIVEIAGIQSTSLKYSLDFYKKSTSQIR